jgi:P2 family phage contractile tail tube protein
MSGNTIRKLTNANVYLNGTSYAGMAIEVTLPEVKAATKSHVTTAMTGKVQVPMGTDEMTLTVKGDFDPAFVAAAADIYHIQLLQIRCNLVSIDEQGRSMEQNVVAHIRGLPLGHKPDALKGGEASEQEYSFNVWAYKLEVDGVPIFDISVTTNKHEVLGKNLNANLMDNLGI